MGETTDRFRPFRSQLRGFVSTTEQSGIGGIRSAANLPQPNNTCHNPGFESPQKTVSSTAIDQVEFLAIMNAVPLWDDRGCYQFGNLGVIDTLVDSIANLPRGVTVARQILVLFV